MIIRRDFLRLLGLGTAAAAVPTALLLEPRRKLWQVPSNAPVGSRVERAFGLDSWIPNDHIQQWRPYGLESVSPLDDDDDPEPLNFLRVPQGWEELLAPHRATNLEVCKRGLSAAEIHELANISAEFHREKLELQRGLVTQHIQALINVMVNGSVDAPTAAFSTAWDRGTQNSATGGKADS